MVIENHFEKVIIKYRRINVVRDMRDKRFPQLCDKLHIKMLVRGIRYLFLSKAEYKKKRDYNA